MLRCGVRIDVVRIGVVIVLSLDAQDELPAKGELNQIYFFN